MTGVFVTGTDTEIGKTHASVALIHTLRRVGRTVNAMKPVAAGLDEPSDADRLRTACDVDIDDALLNPIALTDPIAPHVAARRAGVDISISKVTEAFRQLKTQADFTVVEGAGGWMVPLGPQQMMADLVRALELPVLLTVGLRLGCLNHALLSARAIEADGLRLAGWVGNAIDPDMPARADNIAALNKRLPAPCLGLLPYAPGGQFERTELDVSSLLRLSG